jgi:8-oxo-dGTP pyrophosphatase MutT (NUDIX family)
MVPTIVSTRTDAVNTIAHAALTGQDTVRAFQSWFDTALKSVVVGTSSSWTARYVREAGDVALLRAGTLAQVTDAFNPNQPRDKDGKWTGGALPTRYTGSDVTHPYHLERVVDNPLPRAKGITKSDLDDFPKTMFDKQYRSTKTVSVAGLSTLQDYVNPETVAEYQKPRAEQHYGTTSGPPLVIRVGKEDIIVDGTHRLAAEMRKGETNIEIAHYGEWKKSADGKWSHVSKITDAAPPRDRIPPLQTLCHVELQGIAEAVSQQAVRAYANGLLTRQTPGAIARSVQAIIDRVGVQRGHLLVSFICVRAHSAVTLDAFRAAGVPLVGVVAERVGPSQQPPTHDGLTRDAKSKKLNKPKLIEVLTAGDDDVCPTCEDIAEEGPYTLDEAELLIPAHPRCRCAFVPASDARFAHDAPPLADSTTHIAAGVMFLDPTGRALFLKRSSTGDHAGEWCFPGGAVEAGETIEDAARREATKELGLASNYFDNDYIEQIDRRELDGVDFTTYTYHVLSPFKPTLNREHTAHVWRRLDDPPEPLHPGVRATVDRAVLGDAEWDESKHNRHPKGHPDGGKFAPKGGSGIKGAKADIDEYNELMGEQYSKHLGYTDPEITSSGKPEFVVYKGDDETKIESILAKHGIAYEKQYGDSIVTYTTTPSAFDPEPDDVGYGDKLEEDLKAQPASIDMKDLVKVSGKKGSNEGGVYVKPAIEDNETPQKYYIKTPKTKDHVQNELTAAALYKLAGVNTMEYVPVEGGDHVATVLRDLDKDNVAKFTADERHEAQKDFAVHAWLANWDAAGTGGDNQVIVGGKVTTVDTGGSLKYRAQGEPKGDAFGTEVFEMQTLLNPSTAPDAAALYGNMTKEQIKESIARVTAIPDDEIVSAIQSVPGMEPQQQNLLANKLIARKNDLAAQAAKMTSAPVPSDFGTPKVFKTKTEHIKHLLLEGTTAENLKTKMGWKAVSMPQQAAATGLKLEITKKGGVNFYKGTPLTPEGIAAAAAAKVVPINAAAATATATAVGKHDITTTAGNFKQTLENQGIKYSAQGSAAGGEFITLSDPKDVSKGIEIAKYHPQMEKLSAHEYFAPDKKILEQAKPALVFPPATPDELKKAAKNTKLTAQYVPGAPAGNPEAEKLIAAFNAKYEGKEYDPATLQKKVDDFKKLQADMIPLMSAQQKAEAAKAAIAAETAALAKKKANEIPDDFESVEAEQEYWFNKQVGKYDYWAKAEDVLAGSGAKAAKLKKAGLTVAEVAYIKAFTGSESSVNAQMTAGVMNPGVLAFKHIMNDGLDKLPKYDGDKVWRKIVLTGAQQDEYEPGKVVHWKQFSSAAKNKDVWSGNTHFTIHKPQSGVDVEFISSNSHEAEVIMPADTYYRVLSKTPNQNVYGKTDHGTMHIELEEVTYGKYYKKKKKVV